MARAVQASAPNLSFQCNFSALDIVGFIDRPEDHHLASIQKTREGNYKIQIRRKGWPA